jgi:hypothetical protein
MADEKDRFGETMKLLERAKEDIYFAQRDRELIDRLKAQLQKVHESEVRFRCHKCPGTLETYTFQGFVLDRCHECGGIWMSTKCLAASSGINGGTTTSQRESYGKRPRSKRTTA